MEELQVRMNSWEGEEEHQVMTSNNGHQWNVIFEGSKKDAEIIFNAFVEVGFKIFHKPRELIRIEENNVYVYDGTDRFGNEKTFYEQRSEEEDD